MPGQQKHYNFHVDLTAAYDDINRDFLFSSIRNRISCYDANEFVDLLAYQYRSTKPYAYDEEANTEIFQTLGVQQWETGSHSIFNNFLKSICFQN